MSPKDQNILETLNILTLSYRSQKTCLLPLSEEQRHTLFITKENVEGTKISIPTFINTLETLATSGYLSYTPMHEQKFHDEFKSFIDSPLYSDAINQIKSSQTEEATLELKSGIATIFENTIPKDYSYDKDGLMAEPLGIADLFVQGLNVMKGKPEQTIAVVILMPFRSIDRLLSKMNDGIKFDHVKDPGLWYDSQNFILHFEEDSIHTKYNKLSYVHFAMQSLFNNEEITELYYAEIPEFDTSKETQKELKAYYDSLKGFIDANPKLETVFSIHTKYFEINNDYLEHTH